jgi:hypothetical protein
MNTGGALLWQTNIIKLFYMFRPLDHLQRVKIIIKKNLHNFIAKLTKII